MAPRSNSKVYILLILSLFFSGAVFAQQRNSHYRQVRRVPRDPGQFARVKVDGAAIYQAPNFDAPVLGYMDSGKKILVSRRVYAGIGGLGAFYKVLIRPHVFGFITDTDIEIKGAKPLSTGDTLDDESGSSSNDKEDNSEDELYLSRYFGLAYYNYNFSEKLRNQVDSASTTLYGLKFVGPTSLMGGMPLDIDLIFTSAAPSFYSTIANSTSGYMFIGNLLGNLPITQTSRLLVSFGLGLTARYSKWSVSLKNQSGKPALDSQEIAMGVLGELSATVRVTKKFAVRADARYIYEKQRYGGIGAAAEFKY